jgi:hypothetical protein
MGEHARPWSRPPFFGRRSCSSPLGPPSTRTSTGDLRAKGDLGKNYLAHRRDSSRPDLVHLSLRLGRLAKPKARLAWIILLSDPASMPRGEQSPLETSPCSAYRTSAGGTCRWRCGLGSTVRRQRL